VTKARFAYADPPYLGLAHKMYQHQHAEAAEYDELEAHVRLIEQLASYDGWAMSLQVGALRQILPLVPEDTRICAWVKPWASWKPTQRLAYAWEPILMRPVRKGPQTERDWVSANMAMRRGLQGAKPDELLFWMFRAAGLRPNDDFVDLFPGSGGCTRAWQRWRTQVVLPLPATEAQQRRAIVPLDL
jgi:hypothetical protein